MPQDLAPVRCIQGGAVDTREGCRKVDMHSYAVPDNASELLIRQGLITHTQNVSGNQSGRDLCHLQSSVSLHEQQANRPAPGQI